jgi:hypothetical protein
MTMTRAAHSSPLVAAQKKKKNKITMAMTATARSKFGNNNNERAFKPSSLSGSRGILSSTVASPQKLPFSRAASTITTTIRSAKCEDESGLEVSRRKIAIGLLSFLSLSGGFFDAKSVEASGGGGGGGDLGEDVNDFTFKTFTLRAPSFYKEVDVDYDKGRLSGANGLELLIRDSRFGLAGNTITLSKQTSPIDPETKQPLFSRTEDLGQVEEVAEKLVAGENQRSRGANATLKESKKGTVDGTTYYDVSYTKKVKFVDRIVRTRVCVHDNVLFTLTVETDLERGTGEEAQSLDDIVTSFKVL